MTTRKIWKRIIAMTLAIILMTAVPVPIAKETVQAADFAHTDFSISKSLGAVMGVPGAIVNVVKALGAITYATEKNEGGMRDWAKLAISYISNSVEEIDEISDLQTLMVEQHKEMQANITNLKSDLEKCERNISEQLAQLVNTIESMELRKELNDFKKFFSLAYAELLKSHLSVTEMLESPNADRNVLKAKMDDLYMKAYKLRTLQNYIEGDLKIDNKSIIYLYYEYLLRTNGNPGPDNEQYQEILHKSQNFALELYAVDAFQKYCFAYASSYQLNYLYDNGGASYRVQGSLDGFSNELTFDEIKRNIKDAEDDFDKVSSKVSENLSNLYCLHTHVGYSEGAEQYVLPCSDRQVRAYSGASYRMFVLPDELESIFGKDFSFVVSDPRAAEVSNTGEIKVKAEPGTVFTVSYVYGNHNPDQTRKVYSMDFTVTERTLAGGYGIAEAPYLISSMEQLKEYCGNESYWKDGVYAKLMHDLDASDHTLPVIREFYGSFDGGNHTVKNLVTKSGLFETNRGKVKNLILANLSLNHRASGDAVIGGIVDRNYGTIENCHLENSSVLVYCYNDNGTDNGHRSFNIVVGGIASSSERGGTIRNCSLTKTKVDAQASTKEFFENGHVFQKKGTNKYVMTITPALCVGGIVGLAQEAVIEGNYVGESEIATYTYAKYYKEFHKFLFSSRYIYNRVYADIYTGLIAGYQQGSFMIENYCYASSNASNTVQAIAAKEIDDSFATGMVHESEMGTAIDHAKKPAYITSIRVIHDPHRMRYRPGEVINTSGLAVLDNFDQPVYGYSISVGNTDAEGNQTAIVEYMGCQTTFTIKIGCLHKTIAYEEEKLSEDSLIFYTAGIFCHDCGTYIDGREKISHASCKDDDKNHRCDICDADVGVHEVATGSHSCGYCGQIMTVCADDDKDHACDVCGQEQGKHEAEAGGHDCSYCGKAVTACVDTEKDHVCDICSDPVGKHEAAAGSHICLYCGEKASDCADTDRNHACDICGMAQGDHKPAVGGHACFYCGQIMSSCTDADKNHFCDICKTVLGAHRAETGSHKCGYCGIPITNCVDIDKDHACDICGAEMGIHKSGIGNICAYCGKYMGDPIRLSGGSFETAPGLEFSTALTAETVISAGTVFRIRYAQAAVSYVSVSSAFVFVQNAGGELILTVQKNIPAHTAFADLTFKASNRLSEGSHGFLFTDQEESITGVFEPIRIYRMGDVNLDGILNDDDAVLIGQKVIKMLELSDVQKTYANVYNDRDGAGNPLITSHDVVALRKILHGAAIH